MNSGSAPVGSHLSLAELRPATADRLRTRREEIVEAVIHRVLSVAPPSGREAPGYVEALRASIPFAIDHAFDAIEVGEERLGPTPAAIAVQVAASARSKVGLEVVLRRYATGYSTLCDFLHQEVRTLAGESHAGHTVLRRELTALFDRLVIEVSDAYRQEEARTLPTPGQRQLERVRRLLAGELVDPAVLDYPFEGHHLTAIVSGEASQAVAAALASRLDRRLLVGESSMLRCTAWFGGTRALARIDLDDAVADLLPEQSRISFGAPGVGLGGWRRSRRQAEAAELVARRGSGTRTTHYRDVSLIAAALRDPDLARFLTETYVDPLGEDRPTLGHTLITFLERNGNASAVGATLGIARQTVTARIRTIEERLGCPLGSCAAQLETALRLADLDPDSEPESNQFD